MAYCISGYVLSCPTMSYCLFVRLFCLGIFSDNHVASCQSVDIFSCHDIYLLKLSSRLMELHVMAYYLTPHLISRLFMSVLILLTPIPSIDRLYCCIASRVHSPVKWKHVFIVVTACLLCLFHKGRYGLNAPLSRCCVGAST